MGAGTRQDSAWFQAEGLDVTAVDLSPARVARAEAKGVRAYVRDVLDRGFPEASFDAFYSMNALLHVPNAHLDEALRAMRAVLRPGGLGYVGVFGGEPEEGIAAEDPQVPPRFFAFRSDQQLLSRAAAHFDILDFHVYDDHAGLRYQALTLVRPVVDA